MREAVNHGEVFTRGWVVELILDLVGYTPDRDLAGLRIVEPACGSGAFLASVVQRLSASCKKHNRDLTEAGDALQAFDLLDSNVEASRERVRAELLSDGWGSESVDLTIRGWVTQGDYLLAVHLDQSVDFVVGNPLYIRLEDVPRDHGDQQ